jgi:hypothetical protein
MTQEKMLELKAEIVRLHGLVASARNWVNPEEHPAWEEQASAEATSCSREIDCLRAELAAKDKRIDPVGTHILVDAEKWAAKNAEIERLREALIRAEEQVGDLIDDAAAGDPLDRVWVLVTLVELAAKDKRIEELEETLTAIALDAMESVTPFTEGGEDE